MIPPLTRDIHMLKMRKILIILTCLSLAIISWGKPMTSLVESWEGAFKLRPSQIEIKIADMPKLSLWLYQLDTGSKGTCIGFSNEDGDMILAPEPAHKGIQPIYRSHFVLFDKAGIAQIIVTYDVQGNGGMRAVEEYRYDGKQIALTSRSVFHGKHDSVWKHE